LADLPDRSHGYERARWQGAERRAGEADGLLRALAYQGRLEFHGLLEIGASYGMDFHAVSRWIVVAERGGLLACCGMGAAGSWFSLTERGREAAGRARTPSRPLDRG
jgi:hypothetical protein